MGTAVDILRATGGSLTGSINILSRGADDAGIADSSAVFNAISNGTFVVPAGDYLIDLDTTIPADVHLIMEYGAKFTISNLFQLTLNCSIDAGPWQIFDGLGTVVGAPKIPYVYAEWFGVANTAGTDDSFEINAAITFAQKVGEVRLLGKTYYISDTVHLLRGVRLKGTGCFDTIANAATKIYLNDNSDVAMLDCEAGTHYMAIENIGFDGNSANQTTAAGGVYFNGFIGSLVRFVFITDILGEGLVLGDGAADVQLDHVWIEGCVCTTSQYALDINPTTSTLGGLINADHLYVENTSNKVGGTPSSTPADRGFGIRIRKAVRCHIKDLHIEGMLRPIYLDGNHIVQIDQASSTNCGETGETENAFVLVKNISRVFQLGSSVHSSTQLDDVIKKETGFSDNNIPDIGIAAYTGQISFFDTSYLSHLGEIDVANEIKIKRVGGTSRTRLHMGNESDDTYHYIDQRAEYLEFGTKYNEASERVFLSFRSTGNAGRSVILDEPLKLGNRTSMSNIATNTIFTFSDVPAVCVGTNAYEHIATVDTGSSTPASSVTPRINGHIFVDTTNDEVYLSVGTTNSDWKHIETTETSTATPAATITPRYDGEVHVDTTNDEIYIAAGTTNSDWKHIETTDTGSATPAATVTPRYVGQVYVDTTGDDAYIAVGLTDSDWKQITP